MRGGYSGFIYDEKLRQELIAKYVKNNCFSEEGFAEVNRRFVYDISKVNPETGKKTNIVRVKYSIRIIEALIIV